MKGDDEHLKKYWSLSSIAYLLTSNSRSRIFTEDSVYRMVREDKLHAERIAGNVRGHGKYALQVEEEQLKADLAAMGYDADALIPKLE